MNNKHDISVINNPTGRLCTPLILSYIRKGFQIGQLFQMHPYTWDKTREMPKFIHSKWRLLLWYFNMVLTFAYSTFVSFRAVQTVHDEEKSSGEKVYMKFIALYFLFPSILQLSAFFHGHKMSTFIQGYMKIFKTFESRYFVKPLGGTSTSGRGNKTRKIRWIWLCGFLLGNVYRSLNCFTVLMMIGSYFRPDSPEHLSSLVDSPKDLSFLQKLPFMCFLGYIELMYHTHCFIVIFVLLSFVFPSILIINELSDKTRKFSSNLLQSSKHKFCMYNAMQIIVESFNETFAPLTVPASKLIVVGFIVLCTYGGIRLQGLVAITLGLIGLFCFILILILFGLFGEFHGRTLAVLETWKCHTDSGPAGVIPGTGIGAGVKSGRKKQYYSIRVNHVWHSKVVRSLCPMKIKLRSCYFVDRKMLPTMISGICQFTVNFLLANE